ncbi:hypothetical protein MXB_3655 [Myxobolus squamalis]|nr:hypothetical protein MXB_3655 [Myxobolus squamalis]
MGIKGLLPFLQPIHQPVHISDFSGQVVGVDAYCWIHKGIFGCALDLAQGKPTTFYICYFIKRVQLMLKNGVIPLLVFDGATYSAKAGKEKERKQLQLTIYFRKRAKYEEMGHELYTKGDVKQAIQCYQKCIDVTPKMAAEIIRECKNLNVSCIVAPYEADAQIAYLYKKGVIHACISEDSDLLVFGCEKVIYKMPIKNATNRDSTFLHLCVLAGCDYLAAIKGVGIATACKLVSLHSSIQKVIRFLRFQKGSILVRNTYEQEYQDALFFFQHHWVFNHINGKITTLSEADSSSLSINNMPYVSNIDDESALQIAVGNLDPISLKRIGNPSIKALKSVYFLEETDFKNDDESLLSPTIAPKRPWNDPEDDEDIEVSIYETTLVIYEKDFYGVLPIC